MTEGEYARLGLIGPRRRVDPPVGPPDLTNLVDLVAGDHRDEIALADPHGTMTFGELQHSIVAAAALFLELGIEPGDRIAGCLPNRNEMVIAFFAVMRLGAVWVGINKILPQGDKKFILSHSGTRLLITDAEVGEQVAAMRDELGDLKHVIQIDTEGSGWDAAMADRASATAPVHEVDAFAPAAIMYTSGTTGLPKGVVHSQHNMITVAAVMSREGFNMPDGVRGSVLPLAITNLMILGPVLAFWNAKPFKCGPTAKVRPLVEWIHAENIEAISFVPAMVYDLLQADLDLPDGMILGSGGAPLPDVMQERFHQRYGYYLATSYGQTEAPTVVGMTRDEVAPQGASGKALPHIRISIRDKQGNELPPSKVGEVCYGPVSEGFWKDVYTPALGYWHDLEKTKALLADGVTHSGDHGSLDKDGWLTIADRSSELILRGGSNVYPAEIERVLIAHPGVADCAVVGKPDLRMGMLTVACILKPDPAIDDTALIEELRDLASANLARYKIPDEWRVLDAFPRNAMGKVVKPKLREIVAD